MLSTRLFSHDNNVVTALFNHQYCYNLLTRLSNNDNNSEQACSINIVFSCSNNREQPLLLHQWLNNIVETIVNNLFVQQHCSAMVTMLLQYCSTNNAVTTCAIFSCVVFRISSESSLNRIIGFKKIKKNTIKLLSVIIRLNSHTTLIYDFGTT